jgi:MFS family permease
MQPSSPDIPIPHPGGERSVRQWLRRATLEGAFANVFIVFTGGAFLTGLALTLGADDFDIGLLAAIPFLSQAAQLLSAFAIDRFGNRKGVVLWLSVIGRQSWWLALLALVLSWRFSLEIIMIIILFSNVCLMIATPGWMSWMADLVPEKVRGRYFGYRNAALAASTIVTVLIGGVVLDHFRRSGIEQTGFSVIILAACLFAGAAAYLLSRIPDTTRSIGGPHLALSSILEPIRNRNFRRLLLVFLLWNGSIGIAAPFFAPHMLVNLKMSFTLIAVYTAMSSIAAIALNRPWGILIDRFGSKPVAAVCAFGIAFIPLVWLFPRPGFIWILWIESIYSGSLWAGFNLAAFTIPIAYSPRENRTSYVAMFSVFTGLAFFLSSLAGGVIAQSLSAVHWRIGAQTIINYHFLFAISAVLRAAAAFTVLSFHEPMEARIPIMIQFMGYAVLKRLSVGRQIFPWAEKK